jgi:hypothetical protein
MWAQCVRVLFGLLYRVHNSTLSAARVLLCRACNVVVVVCGFCCGTGMVQHWHAMQYNCMLAVSRPVAVGEGL